MKKILLASAARTASTNSEDVSNFDAIGGHFIINVTAVTTSSMTPTIQGKDPISGNYYTILAGTAITATGTVVLKVHPSIAASPGASAQDLLPHTWRISCAKGDASSWTYSVSFSGSR